MDFLLRRTEELADRYGMLQAGDHILAGVSGGADSVCLLYLLRELAPRRDFQLEAVHVEHGIRGEESESDCAFVRELCARLEIPLSVEHIRVPDLAKALGQGTEETAREERYRIFLETALKTGANKVAVAHNLNDQAETVLWNLTRGSSLRGLGGIRPVRSLGKKGGEGREIFLIRPLIGTRRREIESFLMEKGIPFCTDRTNEDREITRNRIRLCVLPELEALNSRAAEHISLAAEQLRETEDYLARQTAKAAGEMIRSGPEGGTKLLLLDRFFREDPLIRQRVLRECIRGVMPGGSLKDVGRVHVEELLALASMSCGKSASLPGGVRAVREDGILRFIPPGFAAEAAGEEWMEVPLREEGTFSFGGSPYRCAFGSSFPGGNAPGSPAVIEQKRYTKWLSYDTMGAYLCMRTRRSGDYLIVNASGGRQKLKDYFIGCKIPREIRDRIPLLAQGSHILWVVGGRISEGARVKYGDPYIKVVKEDEARLPDGG